MEQLVSDASKLLMQVMMTDSKISQRVLANEKDVEKYKSCRILNNGTIVLGKTSFNWWNQLLNCQDKLPFESFALKIWSSLVDLSSGLNNKAILNGLSLEIVKKSIREKEYDFVVNRLFDCWKHVAQNSAGYQQPLVLEGAPGSAQDCVVDAQRNYGPRQIVIQINGKNKTIPFTDSIGDKFNIGLDVGVVGIRNL